MYPFSYAEIPVPTVNVFFFFSSFFFKNNFLKVCHTFVLMSHYRTIPISLPYFNIIFLCPIFPPLNSSLWLETPFSVLLFFFTFSEKITPVLVLKISLMCRLIAFYPLLFVIHRSGAIFDLFNITCMFLIASLIKPSFS